MKNSTRIALAGLALVGLMYAGCKKNDIAAKENQNGSKLTEGEIAQRLAMQLYGSLSSQFNSNKLTPSSKNGLTVMAVGQCGDVTVTPTDRTFNNGDTTVTEKGNSIFTLICKEVDGKTPTRPNAYTLSDTSHKTESGKGFLNSFDNIINYNVSNQQMIAFYLTGSSYAYAKFATLDKDNNTTEYHDFSTKYASIQILGSIATPASPAEFGGGMIAFSCTQNDFYGTNSEKNGSYKYSGRMMLSGGVITALFFSNVYESIKYEIDFKTGKIISGPTIVNQF